MENVIEIFTEILTNRELISPQRFINAAFAMILALIAGFITGPRAYSAVPAMWRFINISFGSLAERLDNINRPAGDLLMRGFIISLFMILFMGAIGLWLDEVLEFTYQARVIEVVLVSLCISVGAVLHHGMRLHQVLKGAKISKGTYLTLAKTSRIDLSARDDFTLTRVGAETVSRLFDKACVAPLLWYVLGGLPLLFIYVSLSALSWKMGYDGTYNNVGKMVLMLEKLMGGIPTMFASSLLAMTTLIVPFSKPFGGLSAMLSKNKHPYEQGGLIITTITNTLNVTLGGDAKHINGRNMKRNWTGPETATAQLDADHMKRVLYMVFIAQIYMIGALFMASIWADTHF